MRVSLAGVWRAAENRARDHSVQPDMCRVSEEKNLEMHPKPAPLEDRNASPLELLP